jgi:hypothetical protein
MVDRRKRLGVVGMDDRRLGTPKKPKPCLASDISKAPVIVVCINLVVKRPLEEQYR